MKRPSVGKQRTIPYFHQNQGKKIGDGPLFANAGTLHPSLCRSCSHGDTVSAEGAIKSKSFQNEYFTHQQQYAVVHG
jgi:hypothetical protein